MPLHPALSPPMLPAPLLDPPQTQDHMKKLPCLMRTPVREKSRWDVVRSGAFMRNVEQMEVVILWLAEYITADGKRAEWVTAPRLGIQKATLNFVAKFFWLLVRNRVSPTKADNQLTLVHPTRTLGVGLIQNEANVAAPSRGS
ncbi:hypothetical protein H5410_056677 [Solanum commersonii]|uniref:Integrase core domain containing protein n=1 Tax=Solanum commersonii TaxID=4109 RepID=A0A9J5WMY0_SOLCO|nr:hypothetical protein H5410_056677 [Solanum commersonii]